MPDEIAPDAAEHVIRREAATLNWPPAEVDALLERASRFGSAPYFRVPIPGGTLRVEWVATGPEFRRRGLNRVLHEALFEQARASGLRTAHVGTSIGNDAAIAAYESIGFERYAEVRHRDYEMTFGRPGHFYFRRNL